MTETTTVREFIRAYAAKQDVSNGYRAQLIFAINSFAKFLNREPLLCDLTELNINEWLLALKEQGLAADTRKSRRRNIRTLASDAARCGLIKPVNPDMLVRIKSLPTLPDGLSREEARRIVVSVMNANKTKDIRWLSHRYSTGLSRRQFWLPYLLACWDTAAPADLRHLRWRDIEPDGFVSTIRHKTGKPLQWQLSDATMRAIREISEPARDLVFPLWGGINVFRVDARHIITKIAGLKHRSLGDFRSGAGTDVEGCTGNGHQLLGNSRNVFEKHYKIDRLMPRKAVAPRPLIG